MNDYLIPEKDVSEEDRKFFDEWINYKPSEKSPISDLTLKNWKDVRVEKNLPKKAFDLYQKMSKKERTEFNKLLKTLKTGAVMSSDSVEWWTPPEIMDLVYEFFGDEGIDIDPCSNSNDPLEANVSARTHFSEDDDGLSKEWNGTVFMNPPYGRQIKKWVNKNLSEFDKYKKDSLLLLPNRSDTKWFKPLKKHSMCLVDGRLKFIDGETGSVADKNATFPSVIVLLTDSDYSKRDFKNIFSRIGDVYIL